MSQLFNQAQDVVTIVSFARRPLRLRAVAPRADRGRARAGLHRRGALQRAVVLAELQARARAPRERLRAPDRGERGDREGGQDLRPERLPDGALRDARDELLPGEPEDRDPPRGVGKPSSPRSAPVAYYVAYAYIVWRTLHGEFSIGTLTFLAGSFRRLRDAPRAVSSPASRRSRARRSISTTSSRSSRSSPRSRRRRIREPFPNPIREGFTFEDVGFRYPGAEHWAVRISRSRCARARSWRSSARTAPARPRS